jgi:UDP-N-acetylmuramoyl-tripeptide--D-alanyl-D-alanine ligase
MGESMLTLGTVVEALTGQSFPFMDQVVTDGAIDSRLAIPGSMFVALPGERTDGHDHVGEAFERGALAALVDRDLTGPWAKLDLRTPPAEAQARAVRPPVCLRVAGTLAALQAVAGYWRATLQVRVIGITGSVGKSSSKELTAEVLERRYRTLRNPGNLNNEIGLPLSMLRLTETHQRAVFEMGFYVPGEIALLCRLARPAVGVVTNVSPVHLERAGSIQAIVDGKAELVESLPPAPDGVAILNADDERVLGMASRTEARVFTYGFTSRADLRASDDEGLGLEGIRFTLHHAGESFHVHVPLLGRHSVHTALRAAAVAVVEGMPWDEILDGLQNTQSQLRLVAVQGPHGALLLDDTYNAAPSSVIAALNLLAELEGRRIAVLGDMLELGEFEERGHRMVGARAAQVAAELVAVGERARWIADEAARSGLSASRISAVADSTAATELLRTRIGAGDVVLIKGSRGMHMDSIVAGLEEAG